MWLNYKWEVRTPKFDYKGLTRISKIWVGSFVLVLGVDFKQAQMQIPGFLLCLVLIANNLRCGFLCIFLLLLLLLLIF
jgi:hypothetical protein